MAMKLCHFWTVIVTAVPFVNRRRDERTIPIQSDRVLLARAVTPEQQAAIGKQGGGRFFLFLETDDFWRNNQRMQAYGVHFCEQPCDEPYGSVVVFEDISGNRWDLLQRTAAN
ncbi:VOC family protein [Aeromonas fluvialis]|uniref:VOC family protein n=1 Tax=Aeromonas fluvialis TaxID=591962 RepID=UPI001FCC4783|nr:VOC family protein [Aeromonas fluvialis]